VVSGTYRPIGQKAKAVWFSVRDQRTLHSPVTRARRGRIMKDAVALCFRLELGVAAPERGFTHAVPPRRLPLAVPNSRPKQVPKRNGAADWTQRRRERAK